MSDDMVEALRRLHRETRVPPKEKVSQVDKGFGPIDVMGHADTTDLLLHYDPQWSWRPIGPATIKNLGLESALIRDADGWPRALWIWLTLHGVARLGVGTCAPKKADAYKELIGDAIRNAAMRFGVGLSLWSKGDWEPEESDADDASVSDAVPIQREVPSEVLARHPSAQIPRNLGLPERIALRARKAGLDDEARHDVLQAAVGVRSSKEVTAAMTERVFDALDGLAQGELELRYSPEGEPLLFRVHKARGPR